MAHVFGDMSLFEEFGRESSKFSGLSRNFARDEKWLSNPQERISLMEDNTLEGDATSEVASDLDPTAIDRTYNLNNIDKFGDDTDSDFQTWSRNDSNAVNPRKFEMKLRQSKEMNDQLLHQSRLKHQNRFERGPHHPALQVLFLDNDVIRKCQTRIENCLRDLFMQELDKSSEEHEDTDLSQVLRSYQYYKDYVLDLTGWNVVDHNRPLNEYYTIPLYDQMFRQSLPCDKIEVTETPDAIKEKRPKTTCFNCGGKHSLNSCMEKRDQQRINTARREFMEKFPSSVNVLGKQRYHIEDDARFSEMKPGIISENLREALGISSQELPPYIYQMRVLGYPPGHLENAKLPASGLLLFDKHGQELTAGGELLEDGEVNDELPQSSEYNFDELVDYPGFNVDMPAGTIDESQKFGMPPMPLQWNKKFLKNRMSMLRGMLSVGYKRKAESCGGSRLNGNSKHLKLDVNCESTVDMDIVDPDEDVAEQPESILSSSFVENIPIPPPPLPVELEVLPPLPEEPSPFSPSVELCHETFVKYEAVETNQNQTPITCTAGQFGGSQSFCLGTPITLPNIDSERASNLPDASKFASGVSGLILHDNLPNATGTFNRLKTLLTNLKN